jgi:entericidin B
MMMASKNFFWVLLIITLTNVLTACNTVEGMGKDVESGGHSVEGAAKDVKKGM